MREASVRGLEASDGKDPDDLDFERFLTMFRDMLTDYLDDDETQAEGLDTAPADGATAAGGASPQPDGTDTEVASEDTQPQAVANETSTTVATPQPEARSIDVMA